jgi:hypothetical protein
MQSNRRAIRSTGRSGASAGERDVRARGPSLLDIVDRSLDKGIVIDGWVAVPLLGCEVISLETHVYMASCETYLKHAEAVERLTDVPMSDDIEAVEQGGAQERMLPLPGDPLQDIVVEEPDDDFLYDVVDDFSSHNP